MRWRGLNLANVFSTVSLAVTLVVFSVSAWAGEGTRSEVYPTYPLPNYGTGAQQALVARGEYLTKMGDCISCHTDVKGHGAAFAGGYGLKTPFGTFYTPNITADPETGIGKWTDKDFIRAMHDGLNPKGENLFPVFSYPSFNRVSINDLLAIKAYLFSIPAVHRVPRKNDVPFPFSWRFLQWGWKILFFLPYSGSYENDPNHTAEWNRGAYIVQGLAHCGECHTPRNVFGAVKRKYALTGAFVEGYYAPDISSTGLAGVSDQAVLDVFSKGNKLHGAGKVGGPMAEVNYNSLRYMSPEDLKAIVVYLRTVKSAAPVAAKSAAGEVTAETGKKIYEDKCTVCHATGAAGAPKVGNQADWTARIGTGMATLVQHAINGFNSMPPKGACMDCSADEIKAAVEYMVAESKGGSAQAAAPTAYAIKPISLDTAKQIYAANCSICHDDGKMGAPKLGDQARWASLIKPGMDILFEDTFKTHEKVPGITCSPRELQAAIKYMVQQGKTSGDYSLW